MQDNENKKPTGRGGAGRGQGRKPKEDPKMEIAISLDADLVQWLDSFGPRRRSFVANMAIRYYKEQDDKLKTFV
ncbi:hypothetical protein [Spirosoma sp. 209]|uniref:hypothetical protein n=1 Tax=Spirosoma sp. 209 TaxID=1955701 RepID=UPI00098D1118|nr:hypothetical protein [Spirosoma sp. 209]